MGFLYVFLLQRPSSLITYVSVSRIQLLEETGQLEGPGVRGECVPSAPHLGSSGLCCSHCSSVLRLS